MILEVVAYVQKIDGARYSLEVKNPFSPGDQLEWIAPEMRGDRLEIGEIRDLEGQPLQRTISASVVEVELLGEHLPRSTDAILRRRIDT